MDEILEWRGGHKNREALVRWKGADDEGGAWPTQWVPRADLTPDLRQMGRIRVRPSEAAAGQSSGSRETVSEDKRRVSPRLAGVVPSQGLTAVKRTGVGLEREDRERGSRPRPEPLVVLEAIGSGSGCVAREGRCSH